VRGIDNGGEEWEGGEDRIGSNRCSGCSGYGGDVVAVVLVVMTGGITKTSKVEIYVRS
jgi:hypothetical protein